MSKADIGVSIGIDGEAEYRQALRNINSETKELKSEIKLWTATYEENANTVEALADKHSILSRQLESQSKKVETYQSALDSSNKAQEQSKEKISRLADSLEEAKSKLEELKNSTNKSEDAIKEQEATVKNLSSTLSLAEKELEKNSNAAINYKTSLNYANAEMAQTQQELARTEKYLKEAENSTNRCATSIDGLGKEVTKTSDELKDLDKTATSSGNGLENFSKAAVGSLVSLGVALAGVMESTEEFRIAYAKLETNSTQAGADIADVSEELKKLDAITGQTDSNIEGLSNLMQAGFTGNNLKLAIESLAGAVIAFPDTLKIESLADGLQETLATGSAIGQYGELLERMGMNLEDFNSGLELCTSESEKQVYALQKLKETGLDQVNKSYRENNVELIKAAEAQFDFRKNMAEIAQTAAPAFNTVMGKVTEGVADFAEDALPKIADGFEWLIDHSDEVIAGLTGIGTSMLTMKAANVIQDIVQGYRTYKTVTEGATIAQYALNTAQAANPIGLIVAGLAAATAAYITYSNIVDTQITASEKLLESHREQIDALKNSSIERENNRTKMDAEEATILKLKNQLVDLTQKEKLSTDEKIKLSEIVEKLNTAIPEMNLSINEQTGLLEQNVEEIEKLIEANLDYLKVEAAKEDLADIAKEQYEAEVQLHELLKEKEAAVKNLGKAEKEYQDTLRDNASHTMEGSVAVSESYQRYVDAKNIVGEYQTSIEELDGVIQNTSAEFERNTEYINLNSQSLKDGQIIQIEYKDTVISASGEVGEAIQATKLAYDEAKQAAQDSLNEQVGLFEKLSSESELNVAEIAENLKSQTETFNLYKDNILAAEQLVEKGLLDDGLLGSIKELGLEGAGYLNELVEASKTSTKDLEEVMNNWAEMQDAKDQLSSTMADVETNYTSTMDDILAQSERTNRMLSEMTEDGFMQMNQTVLTFTPMLGQSTKFMGDNMVGAFEKSMEIANDRSEKMFVFGKTITDSLSEGILNGTGTVSAAIAKMIQDSVNNADVSGLVDSIDKGLGKRMNY